MELKLIEELFSTFIIGYFNLFTILILKEKKIILI